VAELLQLEEGVHDQRERPAERGGQSFKVGNTPMCRLTRLASRASKNNEVDGGDRPVKSPGDASHV